MTQYHHTFGTTSSPKFRVLRIISELGEPTRVQIEDYFKGSLTGHDLLPSNIKGLTTRGLKGLTDEGFIVEVEGNYRLTEEGARVLYEV